MAFTPSLSRSRPVPLWCRRLLCTASVLVATSLQAAPVSTVTLNFVDTDIETVIRTVGQSLNKNFVIDPRVKGNMTLNLDKPLSKVDALKALQASLRAQGFAMVESDNLIRVLPESEAKLVGANVRNSSVGGAAGNVISTQILRLQNQSVEALVPVLRPLITPNNTITAYPASNSLIITDYLDNIQRIKRIIDLLDTSDAGGFDIVSIKNVSAVEVAATLTKLLEVMPTDPSNKVVVVGDARTNSVLLRSRNPSKIETAKELLAKLDVPSSAQSRVHIVPLKFADATKLAETLRAVATTEGILAGGDGDGKGGNQSTSADKPVDKGATSAAIFSSSGSQGSGSTNKVSIHAYVSTNTLVIAAPDLIFNNLQDVIRQLDVRNAQVFIEALIVEINADKAAEWGVQWQGVVSNNVALGTNFQGSNSLSNIAVLNIAANNSSALPTSASPPAGLNIGAGSITNGKITLNALARAFSTDANTNVLSTPTLLMLDNEEGKIVIGQTVPFVTGQYTQSSGTASSPFQTIERKDIGITLKVKPQIGKENLMLLKIFQESSSLQSSAVNAAGQITNKRSLETSVLVEDGQTIVLGGLIADTQQEVTQKVPLLGDIPLLGALFRYKTMQNQKTNLVVFMRPSIVRDGERMGEISDQRYAAIRNASQIADAEFDLPLLQKITPPPPEPTQSPPSSTVTP